MARSDLPTRTGRTPLTDDELLLFDFMFDEFIPMHALRRSVYQVHMNVGYTHRLDDEALTTTIQRLRKQGMIHAKRARGGLVFSLTERGGKLWSLERIPRWTRYLRAELTLTDEGACRLTVASPSRTTAERYFAAAMQAELYIGAGMVKSSVRTNVALVPWKRFHSAFTLRLAVTHPQSPAPHSAILEEQRRWWQTLAELKTLAD